MAKLHLVHFPLVLLAVAALGCAQRPAEPSRGARTTRALVVAQSPRCSVSINKISYDDPGADDSELIELAVQRYGKSPAIDAAFERTELEDATPAALHPDSGPCGAEGVLDSGQGEGSGSGAPVDSGAGPAGLTLGDCGLARLELLNGGAPDCAPYRTLDLSDTPVPADDYVVICSDESTIFATGACDITTAGRARLRNGWLQNGPNDGLRFVAARGAPPRELAYEGRVPGCFTTAPVELREETGEMASPEGPTDDVNIACSSAFRLASAGEAVLRAPNPCAEGHDAGVDAAFSLLGTPAQTDLEGGASSVELGTATQSVVTDAPSPSESGGSDLETIDGGTAAETPLDAGNTNGSIGPPNPGCAGCAVGPATEGTRTSFTAVAALLAAVASLRRRSAVSG